jgi:hypothetical protein
MGGSSATTGEGYADFRTYRTWYRGTGDLGSRKTGRHPAVNRIAVPTLLISA